MKLRSSISKVLTNKNVLYFIAFLSLMNLFTYMMKGDVNHIIVFILVGVIMTYFSKNMAMVLLVSLVSANLFTIFIISKEGFEDAKDAKEGKDGKDGKEDDAKPEKKESNSINLMDSTTVLNSTVDAVPETPDHFEVGKGKRNAKIDYASTITDAYSQLNELIGKDGIKSLTNDTQTLMKQQVQLAESMKAMGPLLEGISPLLNQAKEMMGGLDASSLDGIKSLAKTFNIGQ